MSSRGVSSEAGSDPFGSFLADRPEARGAGAFPFRKPPPGALWQPSAGGRSSVGGSGNGAEETLIPECFARFSALKEERMQQPFGVAKASADSAPGVASLREDVLKAKLSLLQLALQQAETQRGSESSFLVDTREQLLTISSSWLPCPAQKYLRHPERTADAWSHASSEGCEEEDCLRSPSNQWRPSKPLSRSQPLPSSASSPMSRTCSLPALGTNGSSKFSQSTGEEHLLRGWWTRSSCWNIFIGKDGSVARRRHLGDPGGSVCLGDGRCPLFRGSTAVTACPPSLQLAGYFYAFRVLQVDEKNFPPQHARDMSIGFGFSRLSAQHPSCDHPVYAYEIPQVVLLGYGSHLIDKGRWKKTPWNPTALRVGDVVGVLLALDGDLIIFVNGSQVLRVPTSLAEEVSAKRDTTGAMRRKNFGVYPVVDLHGRIMEVALVPDSAPPQVPAKGRDRLR